MNALTYIEHGKFSLLDKPKPVILDPRDAVVRVTLGSICTPEDCKAFTLANSDHGGADVVLEVAGALYS